MSDMRRNRTTRTSTQRPAPARTKTKKTAPSPRPAGNDIYSSAKGTRLSRRDRGRRIIANIVGSLIMAVSLITMAGILVLGVRPFADSTDKENHADADEFGSVAGSVNENVSYILVAGLDKSENLTDVIMVVCYDIKNKKANILQIPRDTYVGTEIATGYTGKINAVYGHARKNESKINALKRVLNNVFGLPIDHHVIINISALRDIVDIVGGITINIEKPITLEDFTTHKRTIKLPAGKNTLNGKLAESWMRERKSYAEGDIGRIKAQRSFYAGFAEKMMSMNTSQMTSVATKCFDKIKTDMNIGQLLGYARAAKKDVKLENIGIYQVPGISQYYRPPGWRQSLSYFSADMNAYIDLVYTHFNPYGDINYDGINIQQIHNGSIKYNVDSGQILEELK